MAPKLATVVVRQNRAMIDDSTLPYPFPVDLTDIHRQCLLTLLVLQLYGKPILNPSVLKQPPKRILEVGCGSGLWSMKCHEWFAGRGQEVTFVGMDILNLGGGPPGNLGMDWKFIQHDMRTSPWPLESESFDVIMSKDMSLAFTTLQAQTVMEELLRVLKPGGVLELWEYDSTFRRLQPHDPNSAALLQMEANDTGAYCINAEANTPLGPPANEYLADYNIWVTKALQKRGVTPAPCTMVGPWLAQECEDLSVEQSMRLALPLDEVEWEKGTRMLDASQIAIRKIALDAVLNTINAYKHVLLEVNGKNAEDWEMWTIAMTKDLVRGGARYGECLEIGAWSARKKGKWRGR